LVVLPGVQAASWVHCVPKRRYPAVFPFIPAARTDQFSQTVEKI